MMRWAWMVAAIGCVLVGCDGGGEATPADDVLRVSADEGMLDPAIVEQFERVTGVQVVMTSPDSPADVRIVTVSRWPLTQADAGGEALAPIDAGNLPNVTYIAPRFAIPDGGESDRVLGLPLGWESVGLLHRSPAVVDGEATWAVIFDPDRQPAKFALLDDDAAMTAIALKYLGRPATDADPAARAAASALVEQVRQSPRRVESAADADVAVMGSAAAHRAMAKDAGSRYVLASQGAVMRVIAAVTPVSDGEASSRRRGLAHRFINYLLDPQISAQFANFSRAATTNEAAGPYLATEDRADPTLYPPPDVLSAIDLLPAEQPAVSPVSQ